MVSARDNHFNGPESKAKQSKHRAIERVFKMSSRKIFKGKKIQELWITWSLKEDFKLFLSKEITSENKEKQRSGFPFIL